MPPANDPARLSPCHRIDAVCDRFEADWRAGKAPRIEDVVAAADPADRDALFRALLAVELELRSKAGESLGTVAFKARFPDRTADVVAVFRELIDRRERPSRETSVSRESVRTIDEPTQPTGVAESAPSRLGRFELIEVLGQGAFGQVYRARDPHLDREVAIKVPRSDAVGSAADRERFLREAKTAATIRHPNVCPIFEAGQEADRLYIVMALIAGKSLAALLKDRQKPLPEKQAAQVARKLALALDAAHQRGVVHRDLKPANVMFDQDRKDVVVMDFGLARRTGAGDAELTGSGMILGTPAYMAPEQARGDSKAVGPAADVWALGVILYEMLTGRRPFRGTAGEVIGKILHVEPEPPAEVRPGVDPRLAAVCLKAMAKDPAQRFASMKEFAAALAECVKAPAAPASGSAPTRGAAAAAADESMGLHRIFAALSDERKQTAAAVDAAVRKARTPWWVWVASSGFAGLMALLGIIFFARTPTATVLINIDVPLDDKSLTFFLDGKPMPAEQLAAPVELTVGTHKLIVKRGETVVREYTFTVSKDAGPRIELKEEPAPQPSPPPPDDGFVPLFNGKDLTGWRTLVFNSTIPSLSTINKGRSVWTVDAARQVLQASADDLQDLQTDQLFKNFTLRFEWRFSPGGIVGPNGSGVVVRSPGLVRTGRLAGADPQGIELDLRYPDQGEQLDVGIGAFVVYDTVLTSKRGQANGRNVRHLASLTKPITRSEGQWNTCEITCDGDRIKAWMNGELINEGWGAEVIAGHISLRSQQTAVEFRNLRIKELAAATTASPAESGFFPLFNGKDLTGWKTHPQQSGGWTVEDGLLTGRSDSVHHLFTDHGDFADFHLRAVARTNRFGNSGIYFRTPFSVDRQRGYPDGYEAQIIHEFPRPVGGRTGSLGAPGRPLATVTWSAIKADEWFTLDVIARGKTLIVLVNGAETARAEDAAYTRGHIALQAMSDKVTKVTTVVQFRSIEVKGFPRAAAAADPDRELAAWFLGKGLNVAITTGDIPRTWQQFEATKKWITPAAGLPAGPFRLIGVSGVYKPITPDVVRRLPDVKNLVCLNLFGCSPFDDGSLNAIANCRELVWLNAEVTKVTDTGLKHLAGMKHLKRLELAYTTVTGAGLADMPDVPLDWLCVQNGNGTPESQEIICRFKQLKMLWVRSDQNGDREAQRLAQCLPGLKGLFLRYARMTDDGLAGLVGLKDLEQLDVAQTRITGEGLRHLAGFPALRWLELSETQLGDDGLKHLRQVRRLADLWLNQTDVTDAGLAHLAGMQSLNLLHLRKTAIGDAGLKHLASLRNLSRLQLDGTRVTDEGTKSLAECRALTGLWLANTAVTDAGLERLKTLPQLAEFGLAKTAVTDVGLTHLAAMRSLRVVDLTGTAVTPEGLRLLKAALPNCQIKSEPPPAKATGG